jgi:hypothetical protein
VIAFDLLTGLTAAALIVMVFIVAVVIYDVATRP